jgi:HEAT repeat protein
MELIALRVSARLAVAIVFASLASLAGSPVAFAGPPPTGRTAGTCAGWGDRAPGAPKPLVPLAGDAIKRLKSGDPARIKSGLGDVRSSAKAGAPAVPAIADLLGEGLSLSLTLTALETLAETESEAASAAIAPYARHRNVALRRAAVSALARTRGPAAVQTLRAALADPDPEVRGLAATGLGALDVADAVPDLFVALDHRVNEAAESIGLLCSIRQCDELSSRVGRVSFEVLTAGLGPMLLRASGVDDDAKVNAIARVRELGTADANQFLADVQGRLCAVSQRVKQALDQAVLAAGPASAPHGTSP